MIVHEKFLNFAGQPCAKLNRDQAIYNGPTGRRSSLITSISPLLFFAPDVYLSQLEKVWIDEMINQVPWKALTSKLSDEWRELVLYSTVLLSANTALLAVPDVDTGFQGNRNPVQILSYTSIISSVGSIILGLLLMRQVYQAFSSQSSNVTADSIGRRPEIRRKMRQNIYMKTSIPQED
jgi:hypothetical protein